MANDITTKTGRSKLTPRREPYWARIRSGFFIGYRKLEQGEGSWIARRREDEKQKYHALGNFADYDEAVKAAEAWAAQLDQGVVSFDVTVEEACRAYVDHRRINNGPASADDADGRFRRQVYGKPIGKIPLAKLQTKHVKEWLYALVEQSEPEDEEDIRKAKDSANRNLSNLKAALNLALKDRLVATDAGWKTVTPFKGVGRRREYLLTLEDRQALFKVLPEDLRILATALLYTAARPGDMAKITIQGFDRQNGTLAIPTGKTKRRVITLSTPARAFFAEQAKGKIGAAPLFTTNYGKAWTKDDWKDVFKDAVRAAKLPEEVVMYHLRHAAISEMLIGGMPSSLVAKMAGTSTAMIDKHYGHLLHDRNRAVLDNLALI